MENDGLPEHQSQVSEEEQWAAFSKKWSCSEIYSNVRHWDRTKLEEEKDPEMLFHLMDDAKALKSKNAI